MTLAKRQRFSWIASLGLTAGLAACSSWFDSPAVQVRAVETKSGPASVTDGLYASAVAAINVRDYGRALDYLQEAKSDDPRDVRVLNALGVVYDKLGRFDLSARYYALGSAIDPKSEIVSRNMAYSAVLQGLMSGNPLASAAPPSTQVVAAQQLVVARGRSVAPPAVPAWPESRSAENLVADVTSSRSPGLPLSVGMPPTLSLASAWNSVTTTTKEQPSASQASRYPFSTSAPAVHLAAVPPIPIQVAKKTVVTIGHPFKILDASGQADAAGVVGSRLTQMGWTIRQSQAPHVQKSTQLFYPPQNASAAAAMQRTLPFPVHLTLDAAGTMRLVVGTDYLSWKPKNRHLAMLWQKKAVIAELSRPSSRGVR